MSRLQKYAEKSSLMDVYIILDENQKFRFNLFQELQISEDRLNYEATEQPSSFAFLGMLHRKLVSIVEDRKLEADKAWNSAYIAAKQDLNADTGRPYSDDMAKAMASVDEDYLEAQKEFISAKYRAGLLETCVDAFDQRASLIQTISANNRKS